MKRLFQIVIPFCLALSTAPFTPAQAAEACDLSYWNASESHPDEILSISGLYEEVWANGERLFFTDRCRTQLLWSMDCSDAGNCIAQHPGLQVAITPSGQVALLGNFPQDARLSYLLDGMIADTPRVFSEPIDALLESYLVEGGQLLIETPDENVEILDLTGFDAIVALLRDLSGRHLIEEQPTIMSRYESLHHSSKDDPYVFLPATKPQIQFAIRAQGGNPFRPTTPGEN